LVVIIVAVVKGQRKIVLPVGFAVDSVP